MLVLVVFSSYRNAEPYLEYVFGDYMTSIIISHDSTVDVEDKPVYPRTKFRTL